MANVLLRKFGLTAAEVATVLSELHGNLYTAKLELDTLLSALRLKAQTGYSYYDCLMLSSALQMNCSEIFSEDMQHGHCIEGRLTIINPFIGDAKE